jgi:hypothetical protein
MSNLERWARWLAVQLRVAVGVRLAADLDATASVPPPERTPRASSLFSQKAHSQTRARASTEWNAPLFPWPSSMPMPLEIPKREAYFLLTV